VVKPELMTNGDPVDALSFITHRDKAYDRGRQIVDRLREIIPRQMFEVRIQAAIAGGDEDRGIE
jgi:GTP-binding protein LepA